jgi:tryptophan 2,3-dioxygenase
MDVDPKLAHAPSACGIAYGRHWDLYELAEKLVDLDYRFQIWRFGHLKVVERVIGHKQGTGGSSGVPFLAAIINQVFFPELIDVRKAL